MFGLGACVKMLSGLAEGVDLFVVYRRCGLTIV